MANPERAEQVTAEDAVTDYLTGCEIAVDQNGIRASAASGWWAKITPGQARNLAGLAIGVLRSLPVEQRMEAMGMVEVAANLPRGYRRWAEEGTT